MSLVFVSWMVNEVAVHSYGRLMTIIVIIIIITIINEELFVFYFC